ncbi:hypothetical protein TNCV_4076461 [Trichonephila clavipes]|nr:hypothetical protein TNCV_4076461 [Trichonephila clavipes]
MAQRMGIIRPSSRGICKSNRNEKKTSLVFGTQLKEVSENEENHVGSAQSCTSWQVCEEKQNRITETPVNKGTAQFWHKKQKMERRDPFQLHVPEKRANTAEEKYDSYELGGQCSTSKLSQRLDWVMKRTFNICGNRQQRCSFRGNVTSRNAEFHRTLIPVLTKLSCRRLNEIGTNTSTDCREYQTVL